MTLPLDKDNLHHAYIIAGDREGIARKLYEFVEDELNMATQGNPDFLYIERETFGIGEGRELRRAQQQKAFEGEKKIFCISFEDITHEAQNALLKSFEEPTDGTHFFVATPTLEHFLPTLLSRVEVIEYTKESEVSDESEATAFLRAPIPKRLEMLKDIISNNDRAGARKLLDSMERALHEHGVRESARSLEEIDYVKKYISVRGGSLKTLLQHTALVLPKM